MSSFRRIPLFAVLAVVLVVSGVLSATARSHNPNQLPSGLSFNADAESTALYCTGLTSPKYGASGHVLFVNTTNTAHLLKIDDVSDAGGSVARQALLGPRQSISIDPTAKLSGDSYGVGALISGGGVVGVEITKGDTGEAPCISTGVTNWFATGFDTTVGSSTELSVYNPTATPAVFNVATYSSAGYVAPPKFQGYAVGAHAQVELDLGTQLVNATNIGVHVRVLRGTLDIVGVQQSGTTVSLNAGTATPLRSAVFPRVTTAQNAVAQIRLSNPGPDPAQVALAVVLAPYHPPTQSVTVPGYGSALVAITPNPAIPAAGYASVHMRSTRPVIASLATGTDKQIALTAPELPESEFLVDDVTGRGFDAATLTNVAAKAINVTMTSLAPLTTLPHVGGEGRVNGDTTLNIRTVIPAFATLRRAFFLVQASRPTLLVTLTLPTKPPGMTVVEPLDGR